jgi:hypothetical protein
MGSDFVFGSPLRSFDSSNYYFTSGLVGILSGLNSWLRLKRTWPRRFADKQFDIGD